MKIQICGGGCAKCDQLEKNVRAAVLALGLEADFEKVKDYIRLADLGIMTTPALVVDGAVVSAGRVLTVDQAKELLVRPRSKE